MRLLNRICKGKTIELIAVLICLAFANACGGRPSSGGEANEAKAKTGEAINVSTAKSESRHVAAAIEATGSLIANESSDIAPRVAGKVANVSVNVGDFVAQSAVIAKIDDKTAQLQLATSKASVKQAIAAVRQAEARLGLNPNGAFNSTTVPEVRSANSVYLQAVAEFKQAQANEKRYRELVETGDVAMITYETFRTTRDTAQARMNSAKDQLDAAVNTAKQSNRAILSAQAAVEATQTQVATAEQAVADTVIRAPFAGFISSRPVAVGEFVSTASIIATVVKANPIKINIQIAEADVPNVAVGRGVSISVDAYKERNFAGTISAINPVVDTGSRSAVVEATIENNGNLLRSGMFATVKINREGGGTGIFAPKSAVYNDKATQSYRAFVIVDGVAKLKVLQLGSEEGDSIQILEGLEADQTLATSNLEQLYEGAKVVF